MKKYALFIVSFFFYFYLKSEHSFSRMNIGNAYFYSINELVPMLDSSLYKINIYYVKNEKDSFLTNIVQYDNLGRISSFMFLNSRTVQRKSEIKYYENTDVVLSDITTDYTTKDIKVWTYVNSYEYDLTGNKTFQYSYDIDTTQVTTQKFVYKDNQLKKIFTKTTASPKYYLSNVYTYDKTGRMVKDVKKYNDIHILSTILKYEYKGDEIKEYRIQQDGKVLKNTKEYKNGLLVKYKDFSEKHSETIKGTNNTLTFSSDSYEVSYFYDNNKLIEVQVKHSDNSIGKYRLYYVLK